jgi:hypothetical protein
MSSNRREKDPEEVAMEQVWQEAKDDITRDHALIMEQLANGFAPLMNPFTKQMKGETGPTATVHQRLKESGLLEDREFLDALSHVMSDAVSGVILRWFAVHDGESETNCGRVHFYLNRKPVGGGLHERPMDIPTTFEETKKNFLSTRNEERARRWSEES